MQSVDLSNVGDDSSLSKCHVGFKGPTYMIDLQVVGICTRGLLDYGVQVSLVQKEILTLIRRDRLNLPMDV